jgi:hypothetical protein
MRDGMKKEKERGNNVTHKNQVEKKGKKKYATMVWNKMVDSLCENKLHNSCLMAWR